MADKEFKEKKFDDESKSKFKKSNKFRRKDKDKEVSSSSFKPGNDASWWKRVPELMKDAANLKSNWIAGTEIDSADIPYIPAGAFQVLYHPSYGVSFGASHPLNVWARDLYLRMFQKWRGISAYEYPDLGIAVIAQIEVVRMIAKLERIYGVVTRYSKANVNMPFTEEAALGLSRAEADWIRGHLSDYRYDLNELIRKAQRLCIPKDMTILMDQISLLGYEYLDHDNAKAQVLVFDSEHFGVYSDTLLTTGGSVKFERIKNVGGDRLLFDTSGSNDNMFVGLSFMIDSILGSTGINKIAGDLLTWFGQEQLLEIKTLPEDYVVVPTYEESMLHKLHNMECAAGTLVNSINANLAAADKTALQVQRFVLYQYDNNIISKPTIAVIQGPSAWNTAATDWIELGASNGSALHYDHNSVIDTYRVDDNEDTVIEGVLFKTPLKSKTFTSGGTTYYTYQCESSSFEICVSIISYTLSVGGTVSSSGLPNMQGSVVNANSIAGTLAVLDWAPLVYYVSNGQFLYIAGDVDTPIPLPRNAEVKMHRAIIYSGLHTEIKALDKIHN